MASGIVTCVFVLALACLSLAKRGSVGRPGGKLKPCPVDANIKLFFKQLQTPVKPKTPLGSPGQKGAPGRPVPRRARVDRRQRSTNYAQWSYNCKHVGYNHDEKLVEKNTQNCCEDCRFPKFSDCAHFYRNHHKIVGEYVCNSKAIRCITKCINKKNALSKGKPGKPGQLGQKYNPGPDKTVGSPGSLPGPQRTSCTTTTKKVRGSYCLENSCIKV